MSMYKGFIRGTRYFQTCFCNARSFSYPFGFNYRRSSKKEKNEIN